MIEGKQTRHVGPLPAPDTLAGYEKTLPGLANRIMAMAESRNTHQEKHEANMLTAAKEKMRWDGVSEMAGVVAAFVLSTLLIVGSSSLVLKGHPVAGTIFGGGTITTLATVFIIGRRTGSAKARQADSEPAATPPVDTAVPPHRGANELFTTDEPVDDSDAMPPA